MDIDWHRSASCSGGNCMEIAWRRSSFSASFSNCVEIAWKSSSYCSNQACVQVGWVKSSASGGNGCVEVYREDHRVLLRDSKKGDDSPVIGFTPDEWTSFLVDVQGWDRVSEVVVPGARLSSIREPTDWAVCIVNDDLLHLHFTDEEWAAFVEGARDGEFLPETLAARVVDPATLAIPDLTDAERASYLQAMEER